MSDGAARARGEEGEGLRVGASLRRRLALRERIVSRRVRRGRDAEFLFRHAGELLADKWLDLKRPVERVVALTPRDGALLQALAEGGALQRMGQLTLCEPSRRLAMLLEQNAVRLVPRELRSRLRVKVSLEDEVELFDAALSFFSLHWEQDLSRSLTTLAALLKADAPFYAVAFGEGTLGVLAQTLLKAESRLRHRVCMRVPSFPSLERAGNAMRDLPFMHQPFVESFCVEADYENLWDLLSDVQAMGESGALAETTPLSREVVALADALYPRSRGRLLAEFHALVLHGWTASAPSSSSSPHKGGDKRREGER